MEKLCSRCGVKFSCRADIMPGGKGVSDLDDCQRTFIRLYYKNSLCPSCMMHVKENFYAFDVSPVYLKNS